MDFWSSMYTLQLMKTLVCICILLREFITFPILREIMDSILRKTALSLNIQMSFLDVLLFRMGIGNHSEV